MGLLQHRSMVVLGVLLAAMTGTSGLLLALEPGPVAPPSALTMPHVERGAADYESRLFDTAQPSHPDRWRAIVIHMSGDRHGSADHLNAQHEKLGLLGLGYHFVIANGRGAPDGELTGGFRWKHQRIGAYTSGPGSDWYNKHAIGICLIGDGDRDRPTDAQMTELVRLVQHLQSRFNIPRDRVMTGPRGVAVFPHAHFRSQLLNIPQG